MDNWTIPMAFHVPSEVPFAQVLTMTWKEERQAITFSYRVEIKI